MKKVGRYTVTVTLKGNYKGTVKKAFDIVPKGTSISKVTAKKKGFTIKWRKQSSQTTGYEVAYSTSRKFAKKDTKTATVKKNKTTSKSISKLKAKKKYYVRIRTYKTVKSSGKTIKLYSGWSKVKTVKTKKINVLIMLLHMKYVWGMNGKHLGEILNAFLLPKNYS